MNKAGRRSSIARSLSYLEKLIPGSLVINFKQAIPFWIASLLVGLIAVAYAKLFNFTGELLKAILEGRLWMIFIMAPISFFLAWLVVQLFAPNAKGSGIPQVMAAIELSTQ